MVKYLLPLLVLAYIVCPYDLIPDFLLVPGWIDDAAFLSITLWYIFYFRKNRDKFRKAQNTFQDSYSRNENKSEHKREDWREGAGPYSTSRSNDPYSILEIAKTASKDEIKAAYRRLASKYHPDKVLHLGEEFKELAEKRFKEIQSAYIKLSGDQQ
jgi:DnaJ like chaperone protein